MDDALDAVQSEIELAKIGLHISDHVRSMAADMRKVQKRRAVAITGASVGTVAAILTAVYGPALKDALAIVGATGGAGLWSVIQHLAEDNRGSFKENTWYYVWTLQRRAERL
ncbi:hypothetical protein GCM10023196_041090 [Actinoallomurus vinaceus]|uniref:Uncharacterized protein n=1 Tax=Actinoallomurus vinaceus TaxID=1080074 RepID=A0ABP8UF24_9ACTN